MAHINIYSENEINVSSYFLGHMCSLLTAHCLLFEVGSL